MGSMLKKSYFLYLSPAVIMLIALTVLKGTSHLMAETIPYPPILAAIIFVLSVIFALAAPIFYRTLFAYTVRDLKNTPSKKLLCFERNLLRIALITPYLGIAAYMLDFPNLYFGGCVLMSLYALYYFYPSQTRLAFEKRIFRVRD